DIRFGVLLSMGQFAGRAKGSEAGLSIPHLRRCKTKTPLWALSQQPDARGIFISNRHACRSWNRSRETCKFGASHPEQLGVTRFYFLALRQHRGGIGFQQ